ncbi:penicillin-binding protein activator [Kordiimonas aestuarii]|uniref:penicillin-binding protein activator n=1 Tax=Kordiimonas aestuarii TaxID=1005925 RepID=UPI0021D33DDB|nr:penicillin-binding protein activator [Kordiimonas aestuarii]
MPEPRTRDSARVSERPEPQIDLGDKAQVPLKDGMTAEEAAQKIHIAILLPLSGNEGQTGRALLRAATMALFDAYDPRLVLLPFDTKADYTESERVAGLAVEAGADIVLGPLLGQNVTAAGTVLARAGIPMIGFSNDQSVAAPGRYIIGFIPEGEVDRVVDYAAETGLRRFAALLPEGLYGNRVRAAFGDAVADTGSRIAAMESYPPDPDQVFEPVKRLGRYEERKKALRDEVRYLRSLNDDMTDEVANRLEAAEALEPLPFDAVIVPEGGQLLRTLAPLLPYYEIDPNKVKLLGTGLWNDESILREPPLQNAWFAAPMPEKPAALLARYKATYGENAPRLATIAYDAMALVASLARDVGVPAEYRFSAERLTNPYGFVGTDGLFRFLTDGTNERTLAILEVHQKGFAVVDAAPAAFPSFGYSLRSHRRDY